LKCKSDMRTRRILELSPYFCAFYRLAGTCADVFTYRLTFTAKWLRRQWNSSKVPFSATSLYPRYFAFHTVNTPYSF
jgi:hypothetical protein